jgi:hypothetical protein
MLTRLVEALVFGPRWPVVAALCCISAPGWIPIVALVGWWGALAIAALGMFGYVYLAANAFGGWRPW